MTSEDLGETSDSEEDSDTEAEEEEEEDEGLEPWETWMKRATRTAEEEMRKAGIDDWVVQQRKRKWRLAGHLARRTDGRWSTRFLAWTPEGGSRERRRPTTRWADAVDKFMKNFDVSKGDWQLYAQQRKDWEDHAEAFAKAPGAE